MKPMRHFLSDLEHQRVLDAIRAAEAGTSGDIVLMISHKKVADALGAAHEAFRKLHLDQATAQNSFLLFVAPKSRTFASVGGTALHEKVGQTWWEELTTLLTRHFKEHLYTNGLVAAIEQAGHALKTHFPSQDTDRHGQVDVVEE